MRKTILLLVWVAAALALASGVVLVAPEERAGAAFPGTNGKIVFTRDPDGYQGPKDPEIYSVWFDGNNLKALTNNSGRDVDPAWSADGKKIAFSNGHGIFVMNANGSNKTLVTNERKIPGKLTANDTEPAFSPNGRKIVFEREDSNPYGYGSIFKIGTDGTNAARIAYGVYHPRSLGWSPDGTRIAYTDRYDSYEPALYVVTMRADGSGQRYHAEGFAPNWAPNGSRMAFASYIGEGGIYKMKPDGTGQKPLLTNYGYVSEPAYSPGGGKIVFESDLDGDHDLYVMDADGTDVRPLTDLPGDEYDPDWQPIR